jgi:DNA (cytosine-5)-methyltransferase 1
VTRQPSKNAVASHQEMPDFAPSQARGGAIALDPISLLPPLLRNPHESLQPLNFALFCHLSASPLKNTTPDKASRGMRSGRRSAVVSSDSLKQAYYNDNDPFVAAWLDNLIRANVITGGTVDGRDIREVKPDDVRGYVRAHFFAGIAGWDYALRLAGWPEEWPVWTGSCPCQPFSVAGKRKGSRDERHLWPEWFRLIAECRPPVIFGEQVESTAAKAWLDTVFDDLESIGYSCGAAVLPAAGVGAPHVRHRIWFVAAGLLSNPNSTRQPGRQQCQNHHASYERRGSDDFGQAGKGCDFWRSAEWILCRDGRARPTQPGIRPLADGIPGRVGRLRAYGNAIVPQVAAEFVRAFMEAIATPPADLAT